LCITLGAGDVPTMRTEGLDSGCEFGSCHFMSECATDDGGDARRRGGVTTHEHRDRLVREMRGRVRPPRSNYSTTSQARG